MHRRNSSLAAISNAQRDNFRAQNSLATHPEEETPNSAAAVISSIFRRRSRTVIIALAISVLLLIGFVQTQLNPSTIDYIRKNSPGRAFSDPIARPEYATPPRVQHPPHRTKPQPPVHLTPEQELGSVIAYLTSLGANAWVPSSVDPVAPLDLSWVLEFDIHGAHAKEEVENLVIDTWALNPVVIFSESRVPASKELKAIFKTFSLRPDPVVFDVDLRGDQAVLAPLMYRLTGSTSLPIAIIGGEPLGSFEDVQALHKSGELRKKLDASGAVVNGKKMRKQKVK